MNKSVWLLLLHPPSPSLIQVGVKMGGEVHGAFCGVRMTQAHRMQFENCVSSPLSLAPNAFNR